MPATGSERRINALLAVIAVLSMSAAAAAIAAALSTAAGNSWWDTVIYSGATLVGAVAFLGACVTIYYLVTSTNRQ